MITLRRIAEAPVLATYHFNIPNGESLALRPLEKTDVTALTTFLSGLSIQTRTQSSFEGYDAAAAKELGDAIGKYDKLRFVIERISEQSQEGTIIGLIEFSFGIPDNDKHRYRTAGITLSEETDCRFGLTIADESQEKGVGNAVFPYVLETTRLFGKKRLILWGGVLEGNTRAIRYYEKHGFQRVDSRTGDDGLAKLDMLLEV